MTTIEIEDKEYTWDELKELKRDAERFRWLRNHMAFYRTGIDHIEERPQHLQLDDQTIWYHATDSNIFTLEAMIDEALNVNRKK